VLPLEVWDVLTGDSILSDHMRAGYFPQLLADTLLALRAGQARTRSGRGRLDVCRGFDFAFISGGLARDPGLTEALTRTAIPFHVDDSGAFVGEAGGYDILNRLRTSLSPEYRGEGRIGEVAPSEVMTGGGMVVDVGQTAIKVSWEGQRFVTPRDWTWIPLASEVDEARLMEQRKRLRQFLAGALRQATQHLPLRSPESVVIALPCELDEDGRPGPCSYAGMEDDTSLVSDALRLAGLPTARAFVLNDAELAAASAQVFPQVPQRETTLVLTLGFGVGAALLLPRRNGDAV